MSQEFVLEDILSRVGESMGIEFVNPQISYTPGYDGGCKFQLKSFKREPSGKIVVEGAEFYVPERIQGNELAIEGYFAHESGHITILDNKRHRAYLWLRKSASPLSILPALVMYFLEEARVDRIARNNGHDEAITELRRYIQDGVRIRFT